MADDDDSVHSAAIQVLDPDSVSSIFSFLSWAEVLNARVVCRQWKEAASVTPVREMVVRKRDIGRDLPWISRAMPNVRAFKIDFSRRISGSEEFDIQEGQEAAPRLAFVMEGYEPPPSVDLTPLQNFHGLQHLALRQTDLNGRYPFLFQFQNLRTLDLLWNTQFKWDLEMLAGLPQLQKLSCIQNHSLTGDLRSVRVLCNTLTELTLFGCELVTGSLDDLFDFPLLEILYISGTKVKGDIRKIGPNDFPSLKELGLGDEVYGGGDLRTIEEAPSIMFARYNLMKRFPDLFKQRRWHLTRSSPERYEIRGHHSRAPPFWVEFVQVGPRMGWRWTNAVCGGACEINWLDPEPRPNDEGYQEYCDKLEEETTRESSLFRGFFKPPTQEEYAQRDVEVPLDSMTARYSSANCWGVW